MSGGSFEKTPKEQGNMEKSKKQEQEIGYPNNVRLDIHLFKKYFLIVPSWPNTDPFCLQRTKSLNHFDFNNKDIVQSNTFKI